jgi:hypothetical protein
MLMQEFQSSSVVPNPRNYAIAAADHHPQCFHVLLLAVDGESDNVVVCPTSIASCKVGALKKETKNELLYFS